MKFPIDRDPLSGYQWYNAFFQKNIKFNTTTLTATHQLQSCHSLNCCCQCSGNFSTVQYLIDWNTADVSTAVT